MKRLIAFSTGDGPDVVVEVEEEPRPGMVRAARPGEVAERAAETIEAAFGRVTPAAEAIMARLRDLSERPDEIGVEFGVRLSAEVGAILVAAGGEATFTVTLRWTRRP